MSDDSRFSGRGRGHRIGHGEISVRITLCFQLAQLIGRFPLFVLFVELLKGRLDRRKFNMMLQLFQLGKRSVCCLQQEAHSSSSRRDPLKCKGQFDRIHQGDGMDWEQDLSPRVCSAPPL